MTMPAQPAGPQGYAAPGYAAPTYAPAAYPVAQPVTITSIDVPFGRLVMFFFKAMLAALPAFIAAAIVIRIVFGLIFWLFGGWRYGYSGWL
ncbi:hypothetical protein E8L99_22340 [Phreatobacter aquaticus]|uniref:Uncharacterized protein n=1 Tax=Phreatobacter aquaticus TaxID=2570229 RepID=A0A4D7QQN4_9HYPH|nr:hypothetical protein [Phreatobacter aquaticus]QCK88303.1 hypothetical protein E8L99_22340 [Phreatobacter aquaticus]